MVHAAREPWPIPAARRGEAMDHKVLIVVTLEGRLLHQHAFEGTSVVVGRHGDCHIVLDNPGASRTHCEISCEDGVTWVNDLGSSNGTFLNGKSIEKEQLHDGDRLTVGKFELHVTLPKTAPEPTQESKLY